MININMSIAKEIKKQEIRYERHKKMQILDIEFMQALEQNNEALKEEIMNKKQRLRDATDEIGIETAVSIDELKSVRPSILDEV